MSRRRADLTVLAGPLVGLEAPAAEEGERASFGFTLQSEGDGSFMNPVLELVTVAAGAAGTPSFVAGRYSKPTGT